MSGATIAAVAAAQKKRQQEQYEEEHLTKYNADDLEGWEFKIVRSNTGKFKKYEYLLQVIQEESQNGWEMVEKFDDGRVRFKRKISRRSMDPHAKIDPYRTTVGMGQGALVAVILLTIFGAVGVMLGIIFFVKYAVG
jgi:hypothetical protein